MARSFLASAKLRESLRSFDVRLFLKGRAIIIGLNCSDEELQQIRRVSETAIQKLEQKISMWLGANRRLPRVPVLYFGHRVSFESVPYDLKPLVSVPRYACWWETYGCVVFQGPATCFALERPVLHELAHAWTDSLSDAFPYPRGMKEGLAVYAEFRCVSERDTRPTTITHGSILQYTGNGSGVKTWTLRNLLCDELWPDLYASTTVRSEAAIAAYYLVSFLARIGRSWPELRSMWVGIRKNGLKNADAIIAWICSITGLCEDDLERAFSFHLEQACFD